MIYILPIEPIETRYTEQWYRNIPEYISNYLNTKGLDIGVITVDGDDVGGNTSEGAFLNFGSTNIYKSSQLNKISRMFSENKIKDGDYILITDAWNPSVINIRYMIELLGVDVKIGGLWHAGAYDPYDFLGRAAGNSVWAKQTEEALFSCYDHNFFATDFHIDMFEKSRNVVDRDKIIRSGWPMEYLEKEITRDFDSHLDKENIILFPHRIAPEKNLDIFKKLEELMPQYEFIVCQEQKLTKKDYHKLLQRSKMVFSASDQETLGISWYEGILSGCIPFVPRKLSYSEMVGNAKFDFVYDPELVNDLDQMALDIDYVMTNYNHYSAYLKGLESYMGRHYFSGDIIYDTIYKSCVGKNI